MTIVEAVTGHVEFSFLPLAEKKEIAIFLSGDNLDAQILNWHGDAGCKLKNQHFLFNYLVEKTCLSWTYFID